MVAPNLRAPRLSTHDLNMYVSVVVSKRQQEDGAFLVRVGQPDSLRAKSASCSGAVRWMASTNDSLCRASIVRGVPPSTGKFGPSREPTAGSLMTSPTARQNRKNSSVVARILSCRGQLSLARRAQHGQLRDTLFLELPRHQAGNEKTVAVAYG